MAVTAFSPEENKKRLADLESRIREAREKGALYHPTNPPDAWYCDRCCVFGSGGISCWSCEKDDVQWQYVPRWGGGSQTVECSIIEE